MSFIGPLQLSGILSHPDTDVPEQVNPYIFPADQTCFEDAGDIFLTREEFLTPYCSFQRKIATFWRDPYKAFKDKRIVALPELHVPLYGEWSFDNPNSPGLPGLAIRLLASAGKITGRTINIAEYDQKIVERTRAFIEFYQQEKGKPEYVNREGKIAFIQEKTPDLNGPPYFKDIANIDYSIYTEEDIEVFFALALIAEFVRELGHLNIEHSNSRVEFFNCDLIDSLDSACSDCNIFALEDAHFANVIGMGQYLRVVHVNPSHTNLLVSPPSGKQPFFFDNSDFFLPYEEFTYNATLDENSIKSTGHLLADVAYETGLSLPRGSREQRDFFHLSRRIDLDYISPILTLGQLALDNGDKSVALYFFRTALQKAPNIHDTNMYAGRLKQAEGNFEQAAAFYYEALKHDPSNQKTAIAYARALVKLGELDDALTMLQYAESIGAHSDDFYIAMYDYYLKTKKIEEGKNYFEEKLKTTKTSAALYFHAALILEHQDRQRVAKGKKRLNDAKTEEYYLKSFNLDPKPESAVELASVYCAQGKYNLAVEYAKKTIELDADHYSAYWVLTSVYVSLGDKKKAKKYYKKVLSMDIGEAEKDKFRNGFSMLSK